MGRALPWPQERPSAPSACPSSSCAVLGTIQGRDDDDDDDENDDDEDVVGGFLCVPALVALLHLAVKP